MVDGELEDEVVAQAAEHGLRAEGALPEEVLLAQQVDLPLRVQGDPPAVGDGLVEGRAAQGVVRAAVPQLQLERPHGADRVGRRAVGGRPSVEGVASVEQQARGHPRDGGLQARERPPGVQVGRPERTLGVLAHAELQVELVLPGGTPPAHAQPGVHAIPAQGILHLVEPNHLASVLLGPQGPRDPRVGRQQGDRAGPQARPGAAELEPGLGARTLDGPLVPTRAVPRRGPELHAGNQRRSALAELDGRGELLPGVHARDLGLAEGVREAIEVQPRLLEQARVPAPAAAQPGRVGRGRVEERDPKEAGQLARAVRVAQGRLLDEGRAPGIALDGEVRLQVLVATRLAPVQVRVALLVGQVLRLEELRLHAGVALTGPRQVDPLLVVEGVAAPHIDPAPQLVALVLRDADQAAVLTPIGDPAQPQVEPGILGLRPRPPLAQLQAEPQERATRAEPGALVAPAPTHLLPVEAQRLGEAQPDGAHVRGPLGPQGRAEAGRAGEEDVLDGADLALVVLDALEAPLLVEDHIADPREREGDAQREGQAVAPHPEAPAAVLTGLQPQVLALHHEVGLLEGAGREGRLGGHEPSVREGVQALGEGADALDLAPHRDRERQLRLAQPAATVLDVQVDLLGPRAPLSLAIHLDRALEVSRAQVLGQLSARQALEGVVDQVRLEQVGRGTRPRLEGELEVQGPPPEGLMGAPAPAPWVQPEGAVVGARGLLAALEGDPMHGLHQVAPHPMGQHAGEAQLPAGSARHATLSELEQVVGQVQLEQLGLQLVAQGGQHQRRPGQLGPLAAHPQGGGLDRRPLAVAHAHRALGLERGHRVGARTLEGAQVLVGEAQPLGLELHGDAVEVEGLHEDRAGEHRLARGHREALGDEDRGLGRRDRARRGSHGDQRHAQLDANLHGGEPLGPELQRVRLQAERLLAASAGQETLGPDAPAGESDRPCDPLRVALERVRLQAQGRLLGGQGAHRTRGPEGARGEVLARQRGLQELGLERQGAPLTLEDALANALGEDLDGGARSVRLARALVDAHVLREHPRDPLGPGRVHAHVTPGLDGGARGVDAHGLELDRGARVGRGVAQAGARIRAAHHLEAIASRHEALATARPLGQHPLHAAQGEEGAHVPAEVLEPAGGEGAAGPLERAHADAIGPENAGLIAA